MKIQYATISKTGRRPVNEDAFRVSYIPGQNRWMGIVCDGMGGHAMGEMASDIVITKITDYWEQHMDEQDSADKVLKACKKASVAIDEEAAEYMIDLLPRLKFYYDSHNGNLYSRDYKAFFEFCEGKPAIHSTKVTVI